MIKRLLGWVWPKTDPSTLYVIIDELPNPRDWGTLDLIAGNKLIFSEDIDLAAPNTDAIEALIGQYWQEIQSSGFRRIEYKNVSDWLQKRSKRSWLPVGADPDLPFCRGQLTLRMLAGCTAILTCLLKILSRTITRPSASAIW